jgi:DNA-directed RNA polymerase specialized sigma subunit
MEKRKSATRMTKKELSKYYYLSLEINDLEERIETLNETTIGSSQITGMPVTHGNESPIERKVEKLIRLKEKLEKRKSQAFDEMEKIEKYISTIDDIETRLIFNKRYLDFKSWDEIAEEMFMSERTVYRKHSNWLKKEPIES